ncbi:MAG: hypothetical protein MRZ79_21375 [Bacteroidia bacterium]|nr:hypothetical protein [Bacteroidia bacterium]
MARFKRSIYFIFLLILFQLALYILTHFPISLFRENSSPDLGGSTEYSLSQDVPMLPMFSRYLPEDSNQASELIYFPIQDL